MEKREALSPSLIILLHSCVFTGRAAARTALCYVGCTTQYLESNPSRRSDDGEGDVERKKHERMGAGGMEQMLVHEG